LYECTHTFTKNRGPSFTQIPTITVLCLVGHYKNEHWLLNAETFKERILIYLKTDISSEEISLKYRDFPLFSMKNYLNNDYQAKPLLRILRSAFLSLAYKVVAFLVF